MSSFPPPPAERPVGGPVQGGVPAYSAPPVGAPYGQPGYGQYQAQVGEIRPTGMCMLLFFVTLGIYGLYWWFKVHDEMKRHSNDGLGGGLALVLAIFIGIVMPFLTSSEVGKLYERRGQHPPVTGLTGLWYFPGALILVGPFIWFMQTNEALNAYWRSQAAVR
jgi:Domain of unknown function (DUF4234)